MVGLFGGIALLMSGQAAGQEMRTAAAPPSVGVNGSGTPGTVPLWTGSGRTLTDSHIQDSGSAVTVQLPVQVSGGPNGVFARATDATGITFGVQGISDSINGVGVQGSSPNNGVVGIGQSGNGVVGVGTATTGLTFGVQGFSNSPGGVGVQGSSPGNAVVGINQTCDSSGCTSTTGNAGVFVTATGGNLLAGFSGAPLTRVFRVDSTGKGFFDGGTQVGGADFAESMQVSGDLKHYQAGDVLVIDPHLGRRLAKSREPYATNVAGIYSTKPGVLATPHSAGDSHRGSEAPLAIVGIVPCKVSAANGTIKPGDLLVTSWLPGYAMKGTDRSKMLGAVVGKALESLDSDAGLILVLVTLQ
jgi:hypothetical protein